jgi:hypothetical protein
MIIKTFGFFPSRWVLTMWKWKMRRRKLARPMCIWTFRIGDATFHPCSNVQVSTSAIIFLTWHQIILILMFLKELAWIVETHNYVHSITREKWILPWNELHSCIHKFYLFKIDNWLGHVPIEMQCIAVAVWIKEIWIKPTTMKSLLLVPS